MNPHPWSTEDWTLNGGKPCIGEQDYPYRIAATHSLTLYPLIIDDRLQTLASSKHRSVHRTVFSVPNPSRRCTASRYHVNCLVSFNRSYPAYRQPLE